jgi:PKD repeat protein
MQKTNSAIFFFLVLLVFFSCKKKEDSPAPVKPIADFMITGNGSTAPASVTFANKSKNATSYAWNFGDGSAASNATSPAHLYQNAGNYSVSLIAGGDGGKDTSIQSVTIKAAVPQIVASFTYSGANKPAPCTVSFTNTSKNATSYHWNFGDGATSTLTSPTHNFTSAGTFSVTLTATGAGGSKTASKSVAILQPPTTAYITDVMITAMPFINPSNGQGWDTGDGPDVYFKIEDDLGYVIYDGALESIDNVTQSMLPISWSFPPTYYISILDLNANLYVAVLDFDFTDDDLIGVVGPFTLSTYASYPSSITKTVNGVTVTLKLQWE